MPQLTRTDCMPGQVTVCGAGLISGHVTDRPGAHEPASPGLLGSGVVAGLGKQGLPAAAVRDRDRDPLAEGPPCRGERLAVASVDQLADPLRGQLDQQGAGAPVERGKEPARELLVLRNYCPLQDLVIQCSLDPGLDIPAALNALRALLAPGPPRHLVPRV